MLPLLASQVLRITLTCSRLLSLPPALPPLGSSSWPRPRDSPLGVGLVSHNLGGNSFCLHLGHLLRHFHKPHFKLLLFSLAPPDHLNGILEVVQRSAPLHDISHLRPQAQGLRLRELGLGLLLDLSGMQDGRQLGLFGLRSTPVQTSALR